jgi:hypothetical protein
LPAARLDAVNLQEQLDDYEVTTVPTPPALSLVWAEAGDELTAEPEGTLTVLADYRVSRVPSTQAS